MIYAKLCHSGVHNSVGRHSCLAYVNSSDFKEFHSTLEEKFLPIAD